MIVAMLFLVAAAQPAADRCAAFRARAAAVGKVQRVSGADGEDAVRASKQWRGAKLTYAFAVETTASRPFCAIQHVTYEADGFAFGRDDATSHDALAVTLGAEAADDFAHAKLTAVTKDPAQTENFRHIFYRGSLFGYETSTLSNALDVYPLDLFDGAVNAAQKEAESVH